MCDWEGYVCAWTVVASVLFYGQILGPRELAEQPDSIALFLSCGKPRYHATGIHTRLFRVMGGGMLFVVRVYCVVSICTAYGQIPCPRELVFSGRTTQLQCYFSALGGKPR